MAAIPFFLALVLLVAATHKIVAQQRMAAAAARLLGVSAALGSVAAWTAAGVEGVAALALIMPDSRFVGAVIATLLWAGYATLLARLWGRTLDCGCSFASREKPIGLFAVARAAVLAVLGVTVTTLPSATVTPEAPFAALALFALLTAMGELADNAPELRRLAR